MDEITILYLTMPSFLMTLVLSEGYWAVLFNL